MPEVLRKYARGMRVSMDTVFTSGEESNGCDAIIIESFFESSEVMALDGRHYYKIMALTTDKILYVSQWYSENGLTLVCSNTNKGNKIIDAYTKGARSFANLMHRNVNFM